MREAHIVERQRTLAQHCLTPIRTALLISNGTLAPPAIAAASAPMPIVGFAGTGRRSGGKVSEWRYVPAAIERHSSSIDRCVVYSFGIADNDEFSNYYASQGCHVFAFDPTVEHPREWKPNITFFPWGLLSGGDDAAHEEFGHIGLYGSVSGELFALPEIMRRLGHVAERQAGGAPMRLAALKLDCEGCEYEAFRQLYCWDTDALGAAPLIDTISVEFHMLMEMRVVTSADVERIRFAALYLRSRHNYSRYQFHTKPGMLAGYRGGARWVHPDLEAVGFSFAVCCYVYGFVSDRVLIR